MEKPTVYHDGPGPLIAWLRRPETIESKPWILIREALLLNDRAYEVVETDAKPFRRGVVILLWIMGIVVVAQLIGLALGLLTTPRLDILSNQVLERIMAFSWYQEQVALNPEFASTFALAYGRAWQGLRLLFGLPSTTGTVGGIVSLLLSTLGGWLIYGFLAYWVARWLSERRLDTRDFIGVMALSYAPLTLTALELVPGLTIPFTLIFLLMLITKYQAIKRTFAMGPGYTLAATIGPYIVMIILVLGLVLIALGLGLDQIPFADPILRFLRVI